MTDDVTLCILAGGEARRMGKPKAELRIAGQPILAHLLDRMKWTGPTMLVTAPGREHPPACEMFDREIQDPIPGAGPLRGVLTALENLSTPLAVMIGVDMPMIDRMHVDWLVAALRVQSDRPGVMPRTAARIQPLPFACRKAAIDLVRRRLNSDRPSLTSLVDDSGFIALGVDWDDRAWTDLDTPDDLHQFDAT